MSKNTAYMEDARKLLDGVVFENKSSAALARQAERFLENNDGRYAFDYARLAHFMEYDLPRLIKA